MVKALDQHIFCLYAGVPMNLKVTNTTCNENLIYPLIMPQHTGNDICSVSNCSSDILISFARHTVRLFKFDKNTEKKMAKEWSSWHNRQKVYSKATIVSVCHIDRSLAISLTMILAKIQTLCFQTLVGYQRNNGK